jgi:hypothetical protein
MSKIQLLKKLIERRDEAWRVWNENFQKKVDSLMADIAQNCPHPKSFQTQHNWTHDNGYGRLTPKTSPYCTICKKYDWWGRDNWVVDGHPY